MSPKQQQAAAVVTTGTFYAANPHCSSFLPGKYSSTTADSGAPVDKAEVGISHVNPIFHNMAVVHDLILPWNTPTCLILYTTA